MSITEGRAFGASFSICPAYTTVTQSLLCSVPAGTCRWMLCHRPERTFLCSYLQQEPGALIGQAGYQLEHIWNAYSRCASRDSLFLLRADTLKNSLPLDILQKEKTQPNMILGDKEPDIQTAATKPQHLLAEKPF